MMEIDEKEVLFTITCVSNTSIKYLHLIWENPPSFPYALTDEEIRQIIKDDYMQIYNESFDFIFDKLDDSNYYLNISTIESFGNFPWDKRTRYLIEQQIETYKPLIQQFILDPNTYPKLKEK